jgi:hypothetical protein
MTELRASSGDAGHLNVEAGYGKWKEGKALLASPCAICVGYIPPFQGYSAWLPSGSSAMMGVSKSA